MLATKIGLIGAGRMATALARGFLQAGLLEPKSIVASDPSPEARAAFEREVPGVTLVTDNKQVAAAADVLLLAIKPQQINDVLAAMRGAVRPDSLVVSIAAGVTLARLAAGLPQPQPILLLISNTP